MVPDDTYTHGHHASVLRSHSRRTVENSVGYLIAHLTPGSTVLDIGCGPGTITLGLAARVAPGRVVGIDREPAPLTAARTGADEKGLHNLDFAVGDAYALDFADDRFDIVHAHQVLQHLTDPVAALVEMRRVCRPGGLVAVRDADYAAMTWHPANPRLDRWLDIYHRVARHNDAEPDAGRLLKSWTLAAGFTELTCTASAWCYSTRTNGTGGPAPGRSGLPSRRWPSRRWRAGISTPDELADIAAGWQAWADAPDAWFAVLNAEVVAVAP